MNVSVDKATHQVIEISLNGIEVFSIIASVFSIVLGFVAIWLSVVFYKMSEKSSKEIEQSSSAIGSNVQKLDVLFEKMYSDTFGMVKETVSDMRQHVYKSGNMLDPKKVSSEIEKKAKEIVDTAISELHNDKFTQEDVENMVKRIVKESTQVVQNLELKTLIDKVETILIKRGDVTYQDVHKLLEPNVNSTALFTALEKMVEMGKIYDPFDEDQKGDKIIYYNTLIQLR